MFTNSSTRGGSGDRGGTFNPVLCPLHSSGCQISHAKGVCEGRLIERQLLVEGAVLWELRVRLKRTWIRREPRKL